MDNIAENDSIKELVHAAKQLLSYSLMGIANACRVDLSRTAEKDDLYPTVNHYATS